MLILPLPLLLHHHLLLLFLIYTEKKKTRAIPKTAALKTKICS